MRLSNGSSADSVSESEWTEDGAIAFCILNLKGAKAKDLIGTARRLRFLKQLPRYGSNVAVARAVDVSPEIVREFLSLLALPTAVQDLLGQRKLNLEHGRRLAQLARDRPDGVEDTAHALVGMTAMDGRHLVEYIRMHPELSVEQAKKHLIESKTIVVREFHVVAMLGEDEYRQIAREARKRQIPVNRLVSGVVTDWLAEVGRE